MGRLGTVFTRLCDSLNISPKAGTLRPSLFSRPTTPYPPPTHTYTYTVRCRHATCCPHHNFSGFLSLHPSKSRVNGRSAGFGKPPGRLHAGGQQEARAGVAGEARG